MQSARTPTSSRGVQIPVTRRGEHTKTPPAQRPTVMGRTRSPAREISGRPMSRTPMTTQTRHRVPVRRTQRQPGTVMRVRRYDPSMPPVNNRTARHRRRTFSDGYGQHRDPAPRSMCASEPVRTLPMRSGTVRVDIGLSGDAASRWPACAANGARDPRQPGPVACPPRHVADQVRSDSPPGRLAADVIPSAARVPGPNIGEVVGQRPADVGRQRHPVFTRRFAVQNNLAAAPSRCRQFQARHPELPFAAPGRGLVNQYSMSSLVAISLIRLAALIKRREPGYLRI